MIDECGTLDFLADLDKASDTMKANLCRNWKNSNIPSAQSGVFYDNMKTFEAKGKGLVHVIIHASMIYPKVYYCFDVADNDSACCSYPSFKDKNFDVHEHAENVMLMVEHALNDFAKGYKVTKKLISTALSKMKECITEEPDGNRDENGWYICPKCGEKVANPVDSGLCYECDFLQSNPHAKKQYCSTCVHFRYHSVYDNSDFTEFSCAKNLEAKNRDDYCYSCKSFKKRETAEEIDFASDMEQEWINNKPMEKCARCKKEFLTLYQGLCLPCYEKNKKNADEIRRSFQAEGWKEVPEEDYEIAKRNLCGWIDERKMDAMQKRPKQRFFWIDEITLKYGFCFFFENKKEK